MGPETTDDVGATVVAITVALAIVIALAAASFPLDDGSGGAIRFTRPRSE